MIREREVCEVWNVEKNWRKMKRNKKRMISESKKERKRRETEKR